MVSVGLAATLVSACAHPGQLFGKSQDSSAPAAALDDKIHRATTELLMIVEEERPTVEGTPRPVHARLLFSFLAEIHDSVSFHESSYALYRDGARIAGCGGLQPSADKKIALAGAQLWGAAQDARDNGEETWQWSRRQWKVQSGVPDAEGCSIEQPGTYVVRFVRRNRPEKKPLELSFEIVMVPSTAGESLGLANLMTTASLRRGNPDWLYFEHSTDLAEDPELLSLWINVPGDLSKQEEAVELHAYAAGEHVGSASRIVNNDWDGLHARMDNPMRVDAWPDGLTVSKVRNMPGLWQIHVVRNGTYITTCSFSGKDVPELALDIPCSKASGTTVADAVRRSKKVRLSAEALANQREARALHRSEDVRRTFRQLKHAERSADQMGGFAVNAGDELDKKVLSKAERKRLESDRERAQRGASAAGDSFVILQRDYARLVAKHGR